MLFMNNKCAEIITSHWLEYICHDRDNISPCICGIVVFVVRLYLPFALLVLHN